MAQGGKLVVECHTVSLFPIKETGSFFNSGYHAHYQVTQFLCQCQWCESGYRIARKFRGVKVSRKPIQLSFRNFIIVDFNWHYQWCIITFSWIKIFAGGDKSMKTAKILPPKLSSYTVPLTRSVNAATIETILNFWSFASLHMEPFFLGVQCVQ